jgi:non-heme chloroperoxidase
MKTNLLQRYKRMLIGILLITTISFQLRSQNSVHWHDQSPHKIQFVTVSKNVQLEVLDWGGTGKPVILLAGGGNTAHVFDDFAPKLAAKFHVYGITRRGFGASGFSVLKEDDKLSGDIITVLSKDVLKVIDSLKISKPVLIGHSIAGAELSSVAVSHPDRISGLIYLEAGYPYAFDNGRGAAMKEFLEISGPQAPTPGQKDLVSFSTLQKWDTKVYGFALPESEFRQIWDSTSDGRPSAIRDFPGNSMFMDIMTSPRKFKDIPVPALVIFAIPHIQEAWMKSSADSTVRKEAKTYFSALDGLATKQAKAFKEGVSASHVELIKGMHYIFVSNEPVILAKISAFIDSLK